MPTSQEQAKDPLTPFLHDRTEPVHRASDEACLHGSQNRCTRTGGGAGEWLGQKQAGGTDPAACQEAMTGRTVRRPSRRRP